MTDVIDAFRVIKESIPEPLVGKLVLPFDGKHALYDPITKQVYVEADVLINALAEAIHETTE